VVRNINKNCAGGFFISCKGIVPMPQSLETHFVHRTTCRVIYGDTDRMGVAYYANYLRWFEIGRTELFRAMGMPYRVIESKGIFLPVSEVYCKFVSGAAYDDVLIIDASVDPGVRGGIKFDYAISKEDGGSLVASGFTKHAFVDKNGRVVRPPGFIKALVKQAFQR
jgi:acyl-CoA thioester hydrolase